jgi:hypothetical protein
MGKGVNAKKEAAKEKQDALAAERARKKAEEVGGLAAYLEPARRSACC